MSSKTENEINPFWVLESNKVGYKIVFCPEGRPQGGADNGNYHIIADGLKRKTALDMVRRLRNS